MMDFSLRSHDVEIVRGDISLCPTYTDAVAQNISIRLKTIEGEWFLDTSLGIPYFTAIFGQARSHNFVRELLIPELRSIPGIKDIANFMASVSPERILTISFDAALHDGSVQPFRELVGI